MLPKKKLKVIISCSGKFHAFALAEQLEKYGILDTLYTSFSSIKTPISKYLISRNDKEKVSKKKIRTNLLIAIGLKSIKNPFLWNDLFDRWVAQKIKNSKADIFIGWSGMSKHSIKAAKKMGMITILERGSAHIEYQNEILKDEYNRFKTDFSISQKIIDKELEEYKVANYISISSSFVYNSFIQKGINVNKLFVNHYGASSDFYEIKGLKSSKKFIIVYFGALMVRKGIIYLFKAMKELEISTNKYEVWFIGKIKQEVKQIIEEYKSNNWIFKGHIDHKNLAEVLSPASVGIVPSVEDGFGMVVPQLLSCHLPVIVSENTGAADIIEEGKNGFVVPIRDSKAIAKKLQYLYQNPDKLRRMKSYIKNNPVDLSWDAYGERYLNFLNDIHKKTKHEK